LKKIAVTRVTSDIKILILHFILIVDLLGSRCCHWTIAFPMAVSETPETHAGWLRGSLFPTKKEW
jgi:hypothetical protein